MFSKNLGFLQPWFSALLRALKKSWSSVVRRRRRSTDRIPRRWRERARFDWNRLRWTQSSRSASSISSLYWLCTSSRTRNVIAGHSSSLRTSRASSSEENRHSPTSVTSPVVFSLSYTVT